ncbi:MAG: hypothetical protein WBX02_03305, partial [Terriglobales bacterium]
PLRSLSRNLPCLNSLLICQGETRIIAGVMVSSSQIRNALAKYLFGDMSFVAFEDWIVQNTWNVHSSGSSAAESLTFDIEDALSEFSSGRFNENELRAELSQILHAENKVAQISYAPKVVWSVRSVPMILVAASL